MAERNVFERSPLGARVKSPLGVFRARAERVIEIITTPIFVLDGETYEVTGEVFGATQGTGLLEIANTPAFDDVVVSQSVSAWSDTSITFTYDETGLPNEGLLWVRVTNNDAESDIATTQAGAIFDDCGISLRSWGETDYFCDLVGDYCSFGINVQSQLFSRGYSPNTLAGFWESTPGFYLVGATSGKVVEYGAGSLVVGPISSVSFCASDEGLASFYVGGTPTGFFILYQEDSCSGTYGWTSAEDVYLIPRYPVSIQITAPTLGTEFPPVTDISLEAYAYEAAGEITAEIDWYRIDGPAGPEELLGSGSPLVLNDVVDDGYTFDIEARVTNSNGQWRYAFTQFTIVTPTVGAIFPEVGNTAGGAHVTISGEYFTPTSTVEFGGNAATSVTYIDAFTIHCIAPAGTGVVDVSVLHNGEGNPLVSSFTYSSVSDIHITSISPTTGPVAGGTAVTITGADFTADCTVFFGTFNGDLFEATNVVFVSDTEITCDTPLWELAAGVVSVMVSDNVTLAGDIKHASFTYT